MQPFGSARRSVRLAASAYWQGAFFITICTHQRRHLFGAVVRETSARVELSALGQSVTTQWQRSGELRREISLDVFIVMPNHVHGIVWVNREVLQSFANSRVHPVRPVARFVAAMKAAVTRK